MSLSQLKEQTARLPLFEQRELIAFLISKQTELDADFKKTLARKLDGKDRSQWVDAVLALLSSL